MTVETATQVIGAPPGQPIQVVTNITINSKPEREEKEEYAFGGPIYYAAEILIHREIALFPAYQMTHLVAAAAGAALGFYQASHGNSKIGVMKRADAFAKGDVVQKATALVQLWGLGPLALTFAAHNIHLAPGLTGGSLVSAFWGFNLGADLGKMAYQKLFSTSEDKKEI